MVRKLAFIVAALLPLNANAQLLNTTPRALDHTTVTVSGTAVVAVQGPANGCMIQSNADVIVDMVANAGTAAGTPSTSQLQPAGAIPFQCGSINSTVTVTVNCSGAGTCSFYGVRW